MITTILVFLLVLSVLVFVHEGGHYLAARHVGVRVLEFSIGFPPKLLSFRRGDTEYRLGAIPFGGYVRLWGQNLDDEDANDPSNWASKSRAARCYVLLAGPLMNLAVAVVLLAVVHVWGVPRMPWLSEPPRIDAVTSESRADAAGFLAGDLVLRVNDRSIADWEALFDAVARESIRQSALSFAVERARAPASGPVEVTVPASAFAQSGSFGWIPRVPPLVGRVVPDSPAAEAGLQRGDRILRIGDDAAPGWSDLGVLATKHVEQRVPVEVLRAGERVTLELTPAAREAKGWLGVSLYRETVRHGPLQALWLSTQRVGELTAATFTFLGSLVRGNASVDALGGPVKIGAVVGEAARDGFRQLLWITAFISLQLGIFNLLPIPALDGGHMFILGLEKLRGKNFTPKLRMGVQTASVIFLLSLMVLITYNDVLQLLS